MTGAVTQNTIVGIIGFVVMLVSAYVALSSWRGQSHAPPSSRAASRVAPVLQRHRRRPQPKRGSARPVAAVAALDDGALRGAVAPPPRPERRTEPPAHRAEPTRTSHRRSLCLVSGPCRVSRIRPPGRRPGSSTGPRRVSAGRRTGDRRQRGGQPGGAGAAALAGARAQRDHAGVHVGAHLLLGGRAGRQGAGVAGPLDQPDEPVAGPGSPPGSASGPRCVRRGRGRRPRRRAGRRSAPGPRPRCAA